VRTWWKSFECRPDSTHLSVPQLPSAVPDQLDPNLGAEVHFCSKDGASVSEDGGNVASRLTPSSDQILARIAITHVEVYNCIYNITSDFTEFEYVLVNTGTNVSTYLALTLTPGQYSVSDITNVFTVDLDSRLSFTYNSNTQWKSMALQPTHFIWLPILQHVQWTFVIFHRLRTPHNIAYRKGSAFCLLDALNLNE
jgi:hypothetical protein